MTPAVRAFAIEPQQALDALARALATNEEASALCRRALVALRREGAPRRDDLIATLQAYYECGLRVDRTAERLFLHRNSVRYRLDRIRSLLRLNLEDPATSALLMLALRLTADGQRNADGQHDADAQPNTGGRSHAI